MERHAHTINNRQLVDGTWGDLGGVEVPLENGVGISLYSELLVIDDNRLVNPANGDVLYRTRKDREKGETKHYYSRATGVLVNAWLISEVEND